MATQFSIQVPAFNKTFKVSAKSLSICHIYEETQKKVSSLNKEANKLILKNSSGALVTSSDQFASNPKEKFIVEFIPGSSGKTVCLIDLSQSNFVVCVDSGSGFKEECVAQLKSQTILSTFDEVTIKNWIEDISGVPNQGYVFIDLNSNSPLLRKARKLSDCLEMMTVTDSAVFSNGLPSARKQSSRELFNFNEGSFKLEEKVEKLREAIDSIAKQLSEEVKEGNSPAKTRDPGMDGVFFFNSDDAELLLEKGKGNKELFTIVLRDLDVPEGQNIENVKNYTAEAMITRHFGPKKATARLENIQVKVEKIDQKKINVFMSGNAGFLIELKDIEEVKRQLESVWVSLRLVFKKSQKMPVQEFRFEGRGEWEEKDGRFVSGLRSDIGSIVKEYTEKMRGLNLSV